MRYMLLIASIAAALIAAGFSSQETPLGGSLTILYSGDTYGRLESCG